MIPTNPFTGFRELENGAAISLQEHIAYINYHNTITPKEYSEEYHVKAFKESKQLFRRMTSIDQKRKILFLLAHMGTLEAMTTLEKYLLTPDESLRNWAILCTEECKMFLEQAELGEKRPFVIKIGNHALDSPDDQDYNKYAFTYLL
ncbi:hypothetical protein KKC44_05730 [Patescibacteria group bacterium]|nr:hypothetical protein [Patescibacteria group bacterium]MBU2260074.1 hypothetical protein [Patescibacteria group bacterium]